MYFKLSDPFLPQHLKDKLAQVRSFTSNEVESQSFSHSSLLDNRVVISDLYRTRAITLLNLAFIAAFACSWLLHGLHPAYADFYLPKLAPPLAYLVLTRSGRVPFRTLITGILVLAALSNLAFLLRRRHHPEDHVGEEEPFFDPLALYHASWIPLLPVTAVYLLGPRALPRSVACGLAMLALGFAVSPGFHWSQLSLDRVVLPMAVQILPILYLLALDEEAKFYHTLLLKSLKDLEEKSKAKTMFISRMSHELRTPLQGLLSSVSLLKETKLNDDQHTFTNIIDSCGELLLSIMEKILDITRIEAGRYETQPDTFSLLELIPSLLESVVGLSSAKQLDLYVHFDLKAPSYVIHGDQKSLRGVLTNLIGNAVKFTQKGSVSVDVSTVGTIPNTNKAIFRIEINDTGPGIPSKILPNLFEPFTKAHNYHQNEGSGLGLSITKKYIESLGGTIGVTSTVGTGTQFWVEIPFEVMPSNYFGTSFQDDPLHLPLSSLIQIGIYASPQTTKTLSEYLDHWGIHYTVLQSPADFGTVDHLLIEEIPQEHFRFFPATLQALPNADRCKMVLLTSFSDFHQTKARFEQFARQVTVLYSPLTPPKLSKAMSALLVGVPSSVEIEPAPSDHGPEEVACEVPAFSSLQSPHTLPTLDVLLVEDNPVNQMVMRKQFERLNISFAIVGAAEESIRYWQDYGGRISLVLMDVELNGVMTGLEATAAIRRQEKSQFDQKKRTFIAIMTGRALEQDRKEAFESGCDEFLVKPVTLNKVKELIARVVKK